MPTYEYECEKCHHRFDLFQSMKDPAIEVCPEDKCKMKRWGHGPVRRQMGTGAGLIFKGSGFYITDYRSEGYKSAAKKEKDSASPAPAAKKSEGGGSTSDAKPASSPPKSSTP